MIGRTKGWYRRQFKKSGVIPPSPWVYIFLVLQNLSSNEDVAVFPGCEYNIRMINELFNSIVFYSILNFYFFQLRAKNCEKSGVLKESFNQHSWAHGSREYWIIIEKQTFSPSYNLASTPPPPPLPSASSIGDKQEDWGGETTCWRERGKGRSQIIRRRESPVFYKLFNTLCRRVYSLRDFTLNALYCSVQMNFLHFLSVFLMHKTHLRVGPDPITIMGS